MNCDGTTIRLNQTPAHMAAQSAHAACLHWLLGCAAAALDRQVNISSSRSLVLCVLSLQLACLRKLTMVGVDCDGCSLRFHQTPGHLAAFGGHPHVLQWLVQAGACLETQVGHAHLQICVSLHVTLYWVLHTWSELWWILKQFLVPTATWVRQQCFL